MRTTISAAPLAAALLMGCALAGITPAAAGAAFAAQDRVIANFCNGHPQAIECVDWRYNRDRWSNDQYQAFYRDHRNESGFNNAEAAATFGVTADLLAPSRDVVATSPSVGGTDSSWEVGTQRGNVEGNRPEVIGDSNNHVGDCMATFKSYDVGTDSYFAFDGTRHRCKL